MKIALILLALAGLLLGCAKTTPQGAPGTEVQTNQGGYLGYPTATNY